MHFETNTGIKTFTLRSAITAAIYIALLLPFQLNLPLLEGTEIRPSAFIPVVLGIFWGAPAAVGVFIGNLFCDLQVMHTPLVLLGSFLNALSAICARRIFYSAFGHKISSGEYVYSAGSLINFLITAFCVEICLCLPISVIVHYCSEATVQQAFYMIFINNMHSCIILGIPAMMFLPLCRRWGREPQGTEKKRSQWYSVTFVLLTIPLTLPFVFHNPDIRWTVVLILPMAGATALATPSPTMETDPALAGFQSLRHKTFRKLMIIAIVIAGFVSAFYFITVTGQMEQGVERFKTMCKLLAYIDVIVLLLFSISYHMVERSLLTPIRELASKLSINGEIYDNELDIISKRTDFIASGTTKFLSGNEYSIMVGLTVRDGSRKFAIAEARSIIGAICLRHVGGFVSSEEAEGGYCGKEACGTEQILIYTIFGADDGQISSIAKDILSELDQESVLIEKNKMTRYYLYREQRLTMATEVTPHNGNGTDARFKN